MGRPYFFVEAGQTSTRPSYFPQNATRRPGTIRGVETRAAPTQSICLRYEHEFSDGRGLLEQFVRSARICEGQALGHDRVDLATTKQLD